MPKAAHQPALLISAPPYQISAVAGEADDLVISFSSIGHDPARPPGAEFIGSATTDGRPALFVSDAARSWGSAPGFQVAVQAAVAQVRSRQPIRRIVTIGQSMGGYLALRAAEFLPVDVVLAFGPQSNPAMADEMRWHEWTRHLPPLPPLRPLSARTLLFHGLADDLVQALGFAPKPGLDHFLFPDVTHSGLGPHLKTRGLYKGLIACALSGDRRRLVRIVGTAGGHLRQKLQLPR